VVGFTTGSTREVPGKTPAIREDCNIAVGLEGYAIG
jgi:hypothetical protein